MNLPNYDNKYDVFIIGSGGTLSKYSHSVRRLIESESLYSIGINNMSHIITPDYHLWTNKKQFITFSGKAIKKSSSVLIGNRIPESVIKKHYCGSYERIDYEDCDVVDINSELISGNYRTAGVLAIAIAFLMNARHIYIAGMDGFTLHSREDLKYNKNQHCYGSGYTDDASWKKCKKKDDLVAQNLQDLWDYGVRFSILTPTKFEKFYDPSLLEI